MSQTPVSPAPVSQHTIAAVQHANGRRDAEGVSGMPADIPQQPVNPVFAPHEQAWHTSVAELDKSSTDGIIGVLAAPDCEPDCNTSQHTGKTEGSEQSFDMLDDDSIDGPAAHIPGPEQKAAQPVGIRTCDEVLFDTDCELVPPAKDFAAAATGSADTDFSTGVGTLGVAASLADVPADSGLEPDAATDARNTVHQSAVRSPADDDLSLMQPVTVNCFLDAVKQNLPQAEVTAKSQTTANTKAHVGQLQASSPYAGSSSAGRPAAQHAGPSAVQQPSADTGLGQNPHRNQNLAQTDGWQIVSSRRRHNSSQVTADATVSSNGSQPSFKNKRRLF